MAVFHVGKLLGKSVSEVYKLPVDEIRGWLAYLRITNGG